VIAVTSFLALATGTAHSAATVTVTGTATVATFDLGAGRCGGAFAFTAVMVHNLHGDVVPDTIEVVDGTWDAELHAY